MCWKNSAKEVSGRHAWHAPQCKKPGWMAGAWQRTQSRSRSNAPQRHVSRGLTCAYPPSAPAFVLPAGQPRDCQEGNKASNVPDVMKSPLLNLIQATSNSACCVLMLWASFEHSREVLLMVQQNVWWAKAAWTPAMSFEQSSRPLKERGTLATKYSNSMIAISVVHHKPGCCKNPWGLVGALCHGALPS